MAVLDHVPVFGHFFMQISFGANLRIEHAISHSLS